MLFCRPEMRRKLRQGFTLAELLIVVGIIAVLTAVAIPVFTKQLETSREATDLANCRSAFAELICEYYDGNKNASVSVECKQTVDGWNYESGIIGTEIGGSDTPIADQLHIIQGAVLGKRESWDMTTSKVGKGAIVNLYINSDGKIAVAINGEISGVGSHTIAVKTPLTDEMKNNAYRIGQGISITNLKYFDDKDDTVGLTPQSGIIYRFGYSEDDYEYLHRDDVFLQTDGDYWYMWEQLGESSGSWVKVNNTNEFTQYRDDLHYYNMTH